MKRKFIFKDDKSDKFWTVEVEGATLTVIFGKTNTAGNANVKEFESGEEAEREAQKLIKEKLKKGYFETQEEASCKLAEAEFWNLVERAKKKSEDVFEQVEVLVTQLAERPMEDIVEFEMIYHRLNYLAHQSRLWAAAYIINGGCSDDGFEYFKGWLIAQGKEVFYKTLENPDYLARIVQEEEVECEDMMYVPSRAFETKTGKPNDDFYSLLPPDFSSLPEIEIDWREDEEEKLRQWFPKLMKKF